jgi:hypothetical protein
LVELGKERGNPICGANRVEEYLRGGRAIAQVEAGLAIAKLRQEKAARKTSNGREVVSSKD